MTRRLCSMNLLACAVLLLLLAVPIVSAQSTYEIRVVTLCGGGQMTGSTYSLSATIGDPNAGVMEGGTYTVYGGGLPAGGGGLIEEFLQFLPVILKVN